MFPLFSKASLTFWHKMLQPYRTFLTLTLESAISSKSSGSFQQRKIFLNQHLGTSGLISIGVTLLPGPQNGHMYIWCIHLYLCLVLSSLFLCIESHTDICNSKPIPRSYCLPFCNFNLFFSQWETWLPCPRYIYLFDQSLACNQF